MSTGVGFERARVGVGVVVVGRDVGRGKLEVSVVVIMVCSRLEFSVSAAACRHRRPGRL